MKKWYQLRFEEAYPNAKWIPLDSFFIQCGSLSNRLKRFFFVKAHMGGIFWQFSASLVDWKAIYGRSTLH